MLHQVFFVMLHFVLRIVALFIAVLVFTVLQKRVKNINVHKLIYAGGFGNSLPEKFITIA